MRLPYIVLTYVNSFHFIFVESSFFGTETQNYLLIIETFEIT